MGKYLIFLFLLSGCCTVGQQRVELADTLKIPDVKIEFHGTGQLKPIFVTDTIKVSDTGKTIQKLLSLTAKKDTSITTATGKALLSLAYHYPSNVWGVYALISPNPILPGTDVTVNIEKPKPSWKEVYFWEINIPLALGSLFAVFLLILLVRKVI